MRCLDRGMTKQARLVSPSKSEGRSECLRIETVEARNLNGRISMGALQVQTLQFSVERGAAHAERPGCGRDVAIDARKHPLQHAAFCGGKVFDDLPCCAEKIGCR